jgi:hypothetical protein
MWQKCFEKILKLFRIRNSATQILQKKVNSARHKNVNLYRAAENFSENIAGETFIVTVQKRQCSWRLIRLGHENVHPFCAALGSV